MIKTMNFEIKRVMNVDEVMNYGRQLINALVSVVRQ